MSRRLVGWLLLLAWPGVMSGLGVTAFLLWPSALTHPLVLVNWGAATLGAGVGGYIAPAEDGARRGGAACGAMLGAAIYF